MVPSILNQVLAMQALHGGTLIGTPIINEIVIKTLAMTISQSLDMEWGDLLIIISCGVSEGTDKYPNMLNNI